MGFHLSIPVFIILAVFCVLSFFFSLSETALIAINKIKARHLVNKGVKKADIVLSLIMKLDKVISAILIGNNFVNIAFSSIITAIFVSVFKAPYAVILSTVFATIFILVFMEILPKTLAIKYSARSALLTAPYLETFIRIFSPVINLFSSLINAILRILGAEPEKRSPLISEEELKLMIEIGREEGVLSDDEKKMLHRIFQFGDTRVSEVMIPLGDTVSIDRAAGAETLLDVVVEEGRSRIPVYEGRKDNIVGIIYARDLLYIWRNKGLIIVEDLIHPVYCVGPDKRVNDLLLHFQSKRIQLAIVVDENKKALGLVTLEDLLEEIVGEIEEEVSPLPG